VILVDANLLLYAKICGYPQHSRAREWLDSKLNGSHRVGLPWPSLLAFLRISTNPRVFECPLPLGDAWQQVRSWLDLPKVWVPLATDRHAEVLEGVLADGEAGGNLVPGCHLAALAIEHGLVLCSADRDFSRFRDLRWENPLRVL